MLKDWVNYFIQNWFCKLAFFDSESSFDAVNKWNIKLTKIKQCLAKVFSLYYLKTGRIALQEINNLLFRNLFMKLILHFKPHWWYLLFLCYHFLCWLNSKGTIVNGERSWDNVGLLFGVWIFPMKNDKILSRFFSEFG